MTESVASQLKVFFACVHAGLLSGTAEAVLYPVRAVAKNKIVSFLCDLGLFFFVCAVYLAANEAFMLPSLRAYMPIGVIVGVIISAIIMRRKILKYLMTDLLLKLLYLME